MVAIDPARWSGLAPKFRPGGTEEPQWMRGVRRLIDSNSSSDLTVVPSIVSDVLAYFDAERAARFKLLEEIEAIRLSSAIAVTVEMIRDTSDHIYDPHRRRLIPDGDPGWQHAANDLNTAIARRVI